MYNSVTINILAKIWAGIERNYQKSFLKNFNDLISKGFKKLSKGSVFVNLFNSDKSFVEEGLIYKIYCKSMKLFQSFIKKINKSVSRSAGGSFFAKIVKNLFQEEEQTKKALHVFLLSFGVTTLVVNILKGNIKTKSNVVFLVIIFLSILNIRFKNNCKKVLDNSHIVKFIKSIFITEYGGDQWW